VSRRAHRNGNRFGNGAVFASVPQAYFERLFHRQLVGCLLQLVVAHLLHVYPGNGKVFHLITVSF
jgi:hypothetical protein